MHVLVLIIFAQRPMCSCVNIELCKEAMKGCFIRELGRKRIERKMNGIRKTRSGSLKRVRKFSLRSLFARLSFSIENSCFSPTPPQQAYLPGFHQAHWANPFLDLRYISSFLFVSLLAAHIIFRSSNNHLSKFISF